MQPALETDRTILPRAAGIRVPLTTGQQRMWAWKQANGAAGLRTCAASIRILGALNVEHLQLSIGLVVQRHESLRTTINVSDNIAIQVINEISSNHLQFVDLSRRSLPAPDIVARDLGQDFIDRRTVLSEGPLFQALMIRLSDREHVLVMAADTLLSDAISYEVLTDEIWTSYTQQALGLPVTLPPISIQFGDFAVWQEQTHDDWLRKHEPYWKNRLAGVPTLRLSTIWPDALAGHLATAWLHFPFGKSTSRHLRSLSQRHGTPLPLAFLTIYAVALSNWCYQRDLLISLVSHGRHGNSSLKNMIGLLRNHLFLRIELDEDDCYLSLLKKVHLEFTSAYEHQDYDRVPLLISNCLTEAAFNWTRAHGTQTSRSHLTGIEDEISIQQFPLTPHWPPLLFLPFFFDTAAGVCVSILYLPDIFTRATVELFGNSLRKFAASFADDPLSRITLSG